MSPDDLVLQPRNVRFDWSRPPMHWLGGEPVATHLPAGFCGTCDVRVIEGGVDHRDRRLTAEERAAGRMLICTSRTKDDRIVIDL